MRKPLAAFFGTARRQGQFLAPSQEGYQAQQQCDGQHGRTIRCLLLVLGAVGHLLVITTIAIQVIASRREPVGPRDTSACDCFKCTGSSSLENLALATNPTVPGNDCSIGDAFCPFRHL
jgi:hypothetical protein